MKKFSLKDFKIIVDDFHSKLNGNIDCSQNLLTEALTEMFETVSNYRGDFFKVGRFECYLKYSKDDLPFIGVTKGFNVHFRDTKRIMRDFDKPLVDFLNIYANPDGYFMLEAIAFQVQ